MATRNPLLRRAANARYYAKVVDSHRCWSCHQAMPEGDAHRNCPACRERQRLQARDYYQRRKAAREALRALTEEAPAAPETTETVLATRAQAAATPTPEGACWICKLPIDGHGVRTPQGLLCIDHFLQWEDMLRRAAGKSTSADEAQV